MSSLLANIRARALASLIPPPRLQLSAWIEKNIRLPKDVSALPGPVRLSVTMDRYGHVFPSDDHKAAMDTIADALGA